MRPPSSAVKGVRALKDGPTGVVNHGSVEATVLRLNSNMSVVSVMGGGLYSGSATAINRTHITGNSATQNASTVNASAACLASGGGVHHESGTLTVARYEQGPSNGCHFPALIPT